MAPRRWDRSWQGIAFFIHTLTRWHQVIRVFMHPLLNIALRAARDSAESLAHKVDRLDRVQILNDSDTEFLTSADKESDDTLLYHIRKSYPNHAINSRVSGIHQGEEGEPTWLIDPLLGGRNFANAYPLFGVSVAIRIKDSVEHGLVLIPITGDEFIASRGNGAQLNSRRIRVRGESSLQRSFIGLDYSRVDYAHFSEFQAALLAASALPRISGCAALDILDTACGRLQGGWCGQESTPTLAAASLVLLEAGGFIGGADGNPNLENAREIIFGDSSLFKTMVRMRMRINS